MKRTEILKELLDNYNEDPYIMLPVDQKCVLEYDDLVINDFEDV